MAPEDRRVIVIAEDDDQIANLVMYKLQKEGHEVLWGENGKVALEIINERLPDLVILDIMMPIMDGLEVLRSMKESEGTRDIPAIILSAKGMEADILKGFDTGAVDYMTKPFSISELSARVNSVLSRGS